MPELLRKSATNPEFPRVVGVARLKEAGPFAFDISPEPEEAAAIARLMGAQSLRKLRFSGRLAPDGPEGWRLDGSFGATIIQTCVVTLEPVTTRIDQPVRRLFRPMSGPTAGDIVLTPEDDDEIDPLEREIDLGLIALETLALALPAYPRKPGAELAEQNFAAEGVEPLEDAERKPFAALASLKTRLADKS